MGAWIEIVNLLRERPNKPSLPSWERGLKSVVVGWIGFILVSLPSWERGLKSCSHRDRTIDRRSLPSWERGLKLRPPAHTIFYDQVAPFVGAWIEIFDGDCLLHFIFVAPFVGAWIEISNPISGNSPGKVAPFVGAWIGISVRARHAVPQPCRSFRAHSWTIFAFLFWPFSREAFSERAHRQGAASCQS